MLYLIEDCSFCFPSLKYHFITPYFLEQVLVAVYSVVSQPTFNKCHTFCLYITCTEIRTYTISGLNIILSFLSHQVVNRNINWPVVFQPKG